jgi:MoaA/NifB/PqqE/SkfB family radical SAM enzyme
MIIEPLSSDAKNFIKIFWNLTNTCNYNCDYCNPIYKNGTYKWLNNDDYYAFIDNLATHFISKAISIQFTGGEPTINKNFLSLMEYCNNKLPHAYLETYTNGTKNLTWWKKAIKYLDVVHLSVHSQYDTFKIKDLIYFLLDNGLQFLACTVMDDKRHHEKVLKIWEELDTIRHENLFVFLKQLHNSHGYPDLGSNYDELDKQLIQCITFNNLKRILAHPTAIVVSHYPAILKQQNKIKLLENSHFNKNLKGWMCHAGYTSFQTDWKGNIIRCASNKTSVGNIFNQSFDPLTRPQSCEANLCGFFQPQIQPKQFLS